jgi:hypothetical protein
MHTTHFRRDVNLPSVKDFVAKYPHYSAVHSDERDLFDAIITPNNFLLAAAVTDSLRLPAVSALADQIEKVCGARGRLTSFQKQLAGAITCVLMESNGYAKTGQKRAISRRGWSRGELYRRAELEKE